MFSERTSLGQAQRALIQFPNHQTNNVGDQGATAPADGYQNTPADQAAMQQSGGADAEYAHGQAYAAAVDSQGNADCEFGQRGYQLQVAQHDPLKRTVAVDAHTPGNQGPNWGGPSHVPPGETFSREPTNGPQLLPTPGNS
jgi:hypothetical protein